jgi:hypothetical protein
MRCILEDLFCLDNINYITSPKKKNDQIGNKKTLIQVFLMQKLCPNKILSKESL